MDEKDLFFQFQKRAMNVFMIVDTSGSMGGVRISAVNSTIRETLEVLEKVQKSSKAMEIKLALMKFASSAEWITPLPEPVDDFAFLDFTTGGDTNVADAFAKLSEKLTRKEFMNSAAGHFKPLILLLSGGEAMEGWESKLLKLYENMWFSCATRIAVAIDRDATKPEAMRLYREFTQNEEMIVRNETPSDIFAISEYISLNLRRLF